MPKLSTGQIRAAAARHLRAEGQSLSQVGAALGVSKTQVRRMTAPVPPTLSYAEGLAQLFAQQLIEIKLVRENFDLSSFAGMHGPLSGSGCRAAKDASFWKAHGPLPSGRRGYVAYDATAPKKKLPAKKVAK
jgi:hypothetical protein